MDIIAGLVMLSLAWLGLVTPLQAFSGFGSNAVISIIGVMVLGRGIGKTGLMNRLGRKFVALAGSSEKKLLGVLCTAVGSLSAFMQNIGSVAIFLPAVLRISKNTGIPASRLIMPMGFAGILGGTLTMVGSGPLIILNDLLKQGGFEPFGLFSVTPVGVALLLAGTGYFLIFGKYVLPENTGTESGGGGGSGSGIAGSGAGVEGDPSTPSAHPPALPPQKQLVETWQLPSRIVCCNIPEGSPLAGKTREEAGFWKEYGLHLLAFAEGKEISHAPWRYTRLFPGQDLALLGWPEEVERFISDNKLIPIKASSICTELSEGDVAGFAEIIIRPKASIVGKALREIALRKTYGVDPLLLLSGPEEVRGDFSDRPLQTGDTVVVYGPWGSIRALGDDPDFVLLTPVEEENKEESKLLQASFCFIGAILLAFSGFPLAVSLLSGAMGMVLSRVLSIEEAYRAVDWRTVLLLGGLIPLGLAMESSGAAAFLAGKVMAVVGGSHPLVIMFAIAGLTTLFSLSMSNVAATVLLVPLVLLIGESTGLSPRGLALLVGVSASNSFVLPTHQVNALLMGPGGYRNVDYMRAGGGMTLIFLVIAVGLIYLYM